MDIISQIKAVAAQVLREKYQLEITGAGVPLNETKQEFEGDYTIVLFGYAKPLKKSPQDLGEELGQALLTAAPDLFARYNVIKGFLNLTVADSRWTAFLAEQYANPAFGRKQPN